MRGGLTCAGGAKPQQQLALSTKKRPTSDNIRIDDDFDCGRISVTWHVLAFDTPDSRTNQIYSGSSTSAQHHGTARATVHPQRVHQNQPDSEVARGQIDTQPQPNHTEEQALSTSRTQRSQSTHSSQRVHRGYTNTHGRRRSHAAAARQRGVRGWHTPHLCTHTSRDDTSERARPRGTGSCIAHLATTSRARLVDGAGLGTCQHARTQPSLTPPHPPWTRRSRQ